MNSVPTTPISQDTTNVITPTIRNDIPISPVIAALPNLQNPGTPQENLDQMFQKLRDMIFEYNKKDCKDDEMLENMIIHYKNYLHKVYNTIRKSNSSMNSTLSPKLVVSASTNLTGNKRNKKKEKKATSTPYAVIVSKKLKTDENNFNFINVNPSPTPQATSGHTISRSNSAPMMPPPGSPVVVNQKISASSIMAPSATPASRSNSMPTISPVRPVVMTGSSNLSASTLKQLMPSLNLPPGTPLIFASAPKQVVFNAPPGSPQMPIVKNAISSTTPSVSIPTPVLTSSESMPTSEDEVVLESGSIVI